jgi:predicted transcriptional regulator
MRRSKLEMYVDILKVLKKGGALKLTNIMYESNVSRSVLLEYLGFLIKQGLVKERTVGKKRVVFAITQLGILVLKRYRELRNVMLVVEENRNKDPLPY